MRTFAALMLLILGGCEINVYQHPHPASVPAPMRVPAQVAHYYPQDCTSVECAVPVYPSYGPDWITADGYRIPRYTRVFFIPAWRSPPHWAWHHRRFEQYRHWYGYGYDRHARPHRRRHG